MYEQSNYLRLKTEESVNKLFDNGDFFDKNNEEITKLIKDDLKIKVKFSEYVILPSKYDYSATTNAPLGNEIRAIKFPIEGDIEELKKNWDDVSEEYNYLDFKNIEYKIEDHKKFIILKHTISNTCDLNNKNSMSIEHFRRLKSSIQHRLEAYEKQLDLEIETRIKKNSFSQITKINNVSTYKDTIKNLFNS